MKAISHLRVALAVVAGLAALVIEALAKPWYASLLAIFGWIILTLAVRPAFLELWPKLTRRTPGIAWRSAIWVLIWLVVTLVVWGFVGRWARVYSIDVEEAMDLYYRLIRTRQYEEAWEMSEEYNLAKGITLEAFIRDQDMRGPVAPRDIAVIEETFDRAVVEITLYYVKADKSYRVRYELRRDRRNGVSQFGYWVFEKGDVLSDW